MNTLDHTKQKIRRNRGFTIIEVIITITLMSVCGLFLFNLLWNMLSSSSFERERLNSIHDKQSAMATIENDVVLTSRFLSTLDTGLTDPYPPSTNGGAWLYKGESQTSRYLLLRAYTTTNNPLSSLRQPVFIGSGTSCNSSNIYFNEVQRYDIIYFVRNGNLYRRRVVDASTLTCSPQYQKTSCPSSIDLGASQNASCGADDEMLLSGVSNFTISYYGSKTSTTPLDVYASTADPTLVTTAVDIDVTIGVSKRVSGKNFTTQSTLRITKLNMDL